MLELRTKIKEGIAAFHVCSLKVSETQCRHGSFEKCLAPVVPSSHY